MNRDRRCRETGCRVRSTALGYCWPHYQKHRVKGTVTQVSSDLPGMFFWAEWMEQAACGSAENPDVFFTPDNGPTPTGRVRSSPGTAEAKGICARCPVADECAAELWDDKWAIVAGLTPAERAHRDRPQPKENQRWTTS